VSKQLPQHATFALTVTANGAISSLDIVSDTEYFKCPCKECGNNIEFPREAARSTVTCPHCKEWTELQLPEEPKKTKTVTLDLATLAIALWAVMILGLAGAGYYYWSHHKTAPVEESKNKTSAVKTPVKTSAKPVDSPGNHATTTVAAPVTPTRPKSPDDLKVSGIELQKTPGDSLVYAIGTVTNDSDYQRFGVKVELTVTNKKGKKIGVAQDYDNTLQPRQEWHFHALIPESRAAGAKLKTVTED
jgi:hypothetical protein